MADFPDSIPVTEIPRQIVEAEIELLIALLDTLDPDPDLESTADEEPWLGAPDGVHRTNWSGLDCQGNDDREEDTGDDEPWLGASEPAYFGPYSHNSIKDMIQHHMRPDLYAGISTVCTRETSQLQWSAHRISDDREWDDEREPDRDGEGTSNYMGVCSPIETMFPQSP